MKGKPICTYKKNAALLLLVVMGTGCVSTSVVDIKSAPAERATEQLTEDQLLDIGIVFFEVGVPENEKTKKKKSINPDVRKAEAAYIPYVLRNTLEATENWGAVRLIPRPTQAVDLQVGGEIIKSDGEVLVVRVNATDASGRLWLNNKYSDVASRMSYEDEFSGTAEPFQDLYNNIANDLLAVRRQLESEELERIRTISKIKFAAEISPYAFKDYYEVDRKGSVEIKRLPAKDDPMLVRVSKIREREYAFVDLLDEHYEGFHEGMTQPYDDWRRYSYEETIALREIVRASRLTMAAGLLVALGGAVASNKADTRGQDIAGQAALYTGINLMKGGFDLSKQSSIHSDALAELGDSFAQEIQPMLVEVEGRTIELSGTADQQFEQWRELLQEIYRSETGLEIDENDMPTPELKHPENR